MEGTYNVTIRDANGCETTCELLINGPNCETFSVTTTDQSPSCMGGSDGTITLNPSNGSGDYSYNWQSGGNVDSGNGLTLTDLIAGTYNITLTDNSSGCTATVTTTLSEGITLDANCTESAAVSTMGGNDGAATIEITNGTAPYQINWTGPTIDSTSTGQLGNNTVSNLMEGTYNVTIRDANGCENTCSFTIGTNIEDSCADVNIAMPVALDTLVEFCSGASIPILSVESREGYTFNWFDENGLVLGNGNTQYQPLSPGDYFVESEELASGCKGEVQTKIVVRPYGKPIIRIAQAICNQGENATYFVSFTLTDVDSLITSFGTIDTSGNVFTIFDIPLSQPLRLMGFNQYGCSTTVAVPIPACNCEELDPPIFESEEYFFCPSDGFPLLEAIVPQGLTVNWYDRREGGMPLATNVRQFRPKEQGRIYAETVDPRTNCVSQERARALVFPEIAPLIKQIDVFCNEEESAYTVVLEVNNQNEISISAGELSNEGNQIFKVSGIPIQETIQITASNDIFDCSTQFQTNPPSCVCDTLPAPSLNQSLFEYCENESIPAIRVGSPINTTVNWYTEPQGGTLVAQFKPNFQPKNPGKYYAQTVSRDETCISQKRVGVQVLPVPVDTTVFWIETCRLDSLEDRFFVYEADSGCDSVVLYRYFLDNDLPTIYDTQYVCSPALVDTLRGDTILNGCSYYLTTYKWLEDFSEQAKAGDDIFSCEPLDNVQLFATPPGQSTGRWLPTEGATIENPDEFETIAELDQLGQFHFVYALSTENCPDYSKDTMIVWSSGEVEATRDTITILNTDEVVNFNLLSNDIFPPIYKFKLITEPEEIPVIFNKNNTGNLDGTINYDPTIQSGIVDFYYELCDSLCSGTCDTTKVSILVDCLFEGNIEFENGFVPYRNELFDPIGRISNNKSCDQEVVPERSTLLIFDKFGRTIRNFEPYNSWDGKNNNGKIMPVDYYFWQMTVLVTDNDFEKTLTFSGGILLFND